ncbi:hypothetical protein HPB51_025323 [Rhipicephalus microplus]|uniref:Uncharacterized protein n=1 Tax=Rhipicephalus microplus TaxID=6941 RepID=A0A9J6F925_RHIMP|nr:hypothetical protein HPB51_025323 [Rhipicephalus microplus]
MFLSSRLLLRRADKTSGRDDGRGLLQYKVRYSLADVTIYCLPSLPCQCPCEYGIEYPSRCGMCVCPSCGTCSSACYYKVRPGEACPRCAPSEYCFGESANWLHRPRYRSQLVSAHRKGPEKPMPSQKPSHPDGTKEPQKQKPSTKPKEPKKPKPHKTPIKLDTVEKSDVPSEPENPMNLDTPEEPRSLKDPEKPIESEKPKEPEKPH